MEVKATLVEKISKAGNPYKVIEVNITDNVKKLVFLTQSELELISLYYND